MGIFTSNITLLVFNAVDVLYVHTTSSRDMRQKRLYISVIDDIKNSRRNVHYLSQTQPSSLNWKIWILLVDIPIDVNPERNPLQSIFAWYTILKSGWNSPVILRRYRYLLAIEVFDMVHSLLLSFSNLTLVIHVVPLQLICFVVK